MRLKGIFKDKSSTAKMGILFCLIVLSAFLHSLLAYFGIYLFTDLPLSEVSLMQLSSPALIDAGKFVQLFSAIGLFVTPILLYSYLCNFDLKLKYNFNRQTLLLAIAIMLLINPFIAFIYEWNMSFNLPDYLLFYDKKAEELTLLFLQMDTVADLAFNLLVLAIVPAIGEELLFRGYLQQTFTKWLGKPHVAIVITAVLFSAIHMQFQGFIPRFALGLLLGYLFYWSGSLWLPIIAHFINNAIAILFVYPSFTKYAYLTDNTATWQEAFFSFMAVGLLIVLLQKNLSIKKG
jgi:membrane protease YdiL (CAAX protease family)